MPGRPKRLFELSISTNLTDITVSTVQGLHKMDGLVSRLIILGGAKAGRSSPVGVNLKPRCPTFPASGINAGAETSIALLLGIIAGWKTDERREGGF
jgi:hypothetical protein